MPATPAVLADTAVDDDPYHLDASGIREPPSGWRQSLTHLGPGLVLSASIVGSGELIATTTAGRQVGFALLWLVLFSCAVKVAVQIEFARWTIATGSPALSGYNRVPPRLGPSAGSTCCSSCSCVEGASGRRHRRRYRDRLQRPASRSAATRCATPHERSGTSSSIVVHDRAALLEQLLADREGRLLDGRDVLARDRRRSRSACRSRRGATRRATSSAGSPSAAAGALGAAIAMFGITGVGSDEITVVQLLVHREGLCALGRARTTAARPGRGAPADGSPSCTRTRCSRW